jgi:hypothetical protein
MHLNHIAIRILQKYLVPTRYGPATIVRVPNTELIQFPHEPFDVIGTETEMAMPHRIHKLLHLETGIQITLSPVKLDGAIGQKIHITGVGAILSLATDNRVFFVLDGSQIKQRLVGCQYTDSCGET